MTRQWSFHLSLLLAGALVAACASGDLDSDPGLVGAATLAGTTPDPVGTAVGAGTDNNKGIAGAGPVTAGTCCPDGNCLCSTPPPTRLSAAPGPFRTASLNLPSGRAYYPMDGAPPYAGVAIIPGFGNTGPEMGGWGAFYASWGIVTVITNSSPADLPPARAVRLGDAVKDMKLENTRAGSPLNGKMAGRYGTSGYDMGGGATTIATQIDKTLKSSIGLAPWGPVGAGIITPTLHFCGTGDMVAPCSQVQASYNALPATTPKMMITIAACDHLTCWFGPNNTGGQSGGWSLAFQKVYLEGDTRWKPLLLSKPPGATVQTNIQM
jgi:hypothetical protein